MDNIYRITHCDLCGKEIREKFRGHDTLSSGSFEYSSWTLILAGPKTVRKNWTMCEQCVDAVESAIESMVVKHTEVIS